MRRKSMPSLKDRWSWSTAEVRLERLDRGVVAAGLVADRDRDPGQLLRLRTGESAGTKMPAGATE